MRGLTRTRKHISLAALVREGGAALWERPGRSMLTMLGSIFGVATFVAVLGGAATANGQITRTFTELSATQVTVVPRPEVENGRVPLVFPDDAEVRVEGIRGVVGAGRRLEWMSQADISRFAPLTPASRAQVPVIGVTPGFWKASRATLKTGRFFDGYGATRRVAVVGSTVAETIGIEDLDTPATIFVNDVAFLLVGVLASSDRDPQAPGVVYIPASVAASTFGPRRSTSPPQLLIETRLGAAQVVQRQALLAVDPYTPERFEATTPSRPTILQDQVSRDLRSVFLLLAGISLVVGALGIANTTLIAVLERVHEIGLRRALGAARREIAIQFLSEAALLGAAGGIIGTAFGVLITTGLAVAKDWTAILPSWSLACGPLLGCLTGLVAGIYPSWRAARVEPVVALRR